MMQRHHQTHHLGDFRTPQHPSAGGGNSWGGASPLLARDIPKESLEQKYTRLNSTRTCDQIFNTHLYDDHLVLIHEDKTTTATANPKTGFLWRTKMKFRAAAAKERQSAVATATLGGGNGKKWRWFRRWDPQNRWPQGWC